MSNLEHYFENLLFSGKDVNGDWNKNALTKEEQTAVEICADYVLFTLFCGRDKLKEFLGLCEVDDAEPVRHGKWVKVDEDSIEEHNVYKCSECGELYDWFDVPEHKYCRHCGAKMDEVTENER